MPGNVFRVTLYITILLQSAALRAQTNDRVYPVHFNNKPIVQVLQYLTEVSRQPINFQVQQLSPHWRVTLDTSATILQLVQRLFKGQPYTIKYSDGDVFIRLKPSRVVSLRVLNAAGQPLEGVSIRDLVRDSSRHGVTDGQGYWRRELYGDYLPVELTMIGHFSQTVVLYNHSDVVLTENVEEADPVVIAYGKNVKKRIVGNIHTVSPRFIGQPYNNVNDQLRLLPGVLVRNKTDIPWGSSSLKIEGSRSIQPLSADRRVDEPLILVNGVPCPARTGSLSQLNSPAGDPGNAGAGLHPLSFLNVDDIESITILKDATATAIYGTRGANGVVLIELRKPTAQTPRFNLNVMAGLMSSYRRPQTLNTSQFLDLRRSAFPTGTVFNKNNFPELFMDTSLYTNWADELYQHTAVNHTTQLSASGRIGRVNWLGSFNYRRDSYVFPTHNKDEWVRLYNQLSYTSRNKRWEINSFASASIGENAAPATELIPIVFATPHASGVLRGDSLDVYNNPMRITNSQYLAQSNYYLANLQASFSFLRYFKAKLDGGFGWQQLKEKAGFPLSYFKPNSNSTGQVDQAGIQVRTWLVEPQLHFNLSSRKLSWQALLGANYQQSHYRSVLHRNPGYADDNKLRQELVYPRLDSFWTPYKLLSFFGRVNLAIDQRYVVEASLRRDGSSRFARDQRFGTFYSVGGAWVLSETDFWQPAMGKFNLAKLRVSHGVTGNDQVEDFGYMGQYSSTNVAYPYGASPGWVQTLPGSNVLTWAETHKTEAGLQLEYQQQFGLDLGAYWHRSFNQVIKLPLAAQSGFSDLNYWNFPAEVDNRGWEVSLRYKTKDNNKRWKAAVQLNYTRPTNRLHSFPASSVILKNNELLVGQPLTGRKVYHATGIDNITGLYTVANLGGDTAIDEADKQHIRNLEVKGYGSLRIQLQHGRWGLGVIFEGRQQTGYTSEYYANQRLFPGRLDVNGFSNQPMSVLNRWPGSGATYQRPANSLSVEAVKALDQHLNSDAVFTDQSYLCLRHVGLEYTIVGAGLLKGSVDQLRLFAQGSNLFVFSKYREGNPMLTQPFAQPVTRVLTLGAQLSFK